MDDGVGEGVDGNVLAQVRDLVDRACRSNQLLERKCGVHVLEVMSRRGDANLGQVTCSEVRFHAVDSGSLLQKFALLFSTRNFLQIPVA